MVESYINFMYRGENGASQTPTSEGISDLAFWNGKDSMFVANYFSEIIQ